MVILAHWAWGIGEERHGLLAAQLHDLAAASTIGLGRSYGHLLDGNLPGLIYAHAELGTGQSCCHLEGWLGCSCSGNHSSWRRCNSLGYSDRLQERVHRIAHCLGKVH